MKLFFSPLACSLASRVALYEYGLEASFEQVDLRRGKTAHGRDYRELHPLGLVPLLEVQPGERLSENVAILQYIAERAEPASLREPLTRARLCEWLAFITTELHKALYMPLLDQHASAEAKAYALAKGSSRLAELERRLAGRPFALERFSVADAYLFTVLNWSQVTPVDLSAWPGIQAYHAGLRQRPAFARAFEEERALYFDQKAAEDRELRERRANDAEHRPTSARP